ncbi:MAG: hypothetical protein J5I93_05330 [Pirellulaceae bacterium]|nr:hypothetical protein [Pirellulaceae bacterium]
MALLKRLRDDPPIAAIAEYLDSRLRELAYFMSGSRDAEADAASTKGLLWDTKWLRISAASFGSDASKLTPAMLALILEECLPEHWNQILDEWPHRPKARRLPAKDKHARWKELHDSGLSYAQIRQKHEDETGEELTSAAIAKAMERYIPES